MVRRKDNDQLGPVGGVTANLLVNHLATVHLSLLLSLRVLFGTCLWL